MKKEVPSLTDRDIIKKAMGLLGSRTSARKKVSSRENAKKAREAREKLHNKKSLYKG
jgi:hypothetical protein